MTSRARVAVLLACGLAAGAPRAQTPEPQRVEITAGEDSDTDKRRREPVAKQIYGREELDRYGDVSVTEVLKRLPGVSLQGGNPRLRGLGAGYTLILLNGEPAPPGFSLENLSPSMVERIEVTKGPTAEHSAQAVAGTINVVLRQAARQRQREWRLNAGYNTARPVPSTNLVWSDRFDALSVTLPLSAYQWRGSNSSQRASQTLDADGQPQRTTSVGRDDWWGGGLNIAPRLSWKLGETLTLDWQGFAQRNEFRSEGRDRTTLLQGTPPPSVDDQYGNRGHFLLLRSSLQLTRRAPGGGRIEARLGGQASQGASRSFTTGNDADGAQTVDRLTVSRNNERSVTSNGKLLQPLGEAHNVGLGWDLEVKRRHEQRSVLESGVPQLVGFDGQPFEARVTRGALFVQDEWEISPQWSAYGGLRAERISTRSAGLADDLRNRSQVVSPLLHVNFKPVAGGRDLVRASLTRSYRAPELLSLMARPSLNTGYPVSGSNTELAPDRVGNPLLRPELATGLDIAYERYGAAGGVTSIGVFHRRLTDLIRHQVRLQDVPWSAAPRWVSTPVNLAGAHSTGVELEVKGKASELLPIEARSAQDWALRGSLAVYRSRVQGLPAPDNRLEGQQPWSLTLGFDRQRLGEPLSFGASLAVTPSYAVQQTATRLFDQGRARTLDAYVAWAFSRETVLRLSVGNLWPRAVDTRTTVHDDSGFDQVGDSRRLNRAWFNAHLTLRF